MLKTVTNVEFRRSFGELLDSVRRANDPITITRHGIPWVELRSPKGANSKDIPEQESALQVRLEMSDILNRVHYRKEPMMIMRRNRPVACLFPVDT